MLPTVEAWRDRLLETLAERDDALLRAYLDGTEPPTARAAIALAVLRGRRKLAQAPS